MKISRHYSARTQQGSGYCVRIRIQLCLHLIKRPSEGDSLHPPGYAQAGQRCLPLVPTHRGVASPLPLHAGVRGRSVGWASSRPPRTAPAQRLTAAPRSAVGGAHPSVRPRPHRLRPAGLSRGRGEGGGVWEHAQLPGLSAGRPTSLPLLKRHLPLPPPENKRLRGRQSPGASRSPLASRTRRLQASSRQHADILYPARPGSLPQPHRRQRGAEAVCACAAARGFQ